MKTRLQGDMSTIGGLVSISIPFYNRELYLSEAVESVLAQTYARWELFLVDDGSTDRSTEIARSYAERFPEKIYYLQHPGHANCGVTRTRNLGASQSRGEYLAFLDSDDAFLPHKLEHQVAIMEAYPEAGLICGPSEYWYSWEGQGSSKNKDTIHPVAPAGKLYTPFSLLINSHPIGRYGAPCPSSFLLRRSSFDLVSGFVEAFNPDTCQLYEDTAFLTKLYLRVPVYITDCCSDRYRCHPQSIWNRTRGTLGEERERAFYFRWLRGYLRDQAINDPSLWKAIRKEGWKYWLPLPARVTRVLRRLGKRLAA